MAVQWRYSLISNIIVAESALETGPKFFSGAGKAEILKWWSLAQGAQTGPQLRLTGASATLTGAWPRLAPLGYATGQDIGFCVLDAPF